MGVTETSDRDGTASEQRLSVDPAVLRSGLNAFRVGSAPTGFEDDIDDFEITNVRLRLRLPDRLGFTVSPSRSTVGTEVTLDASSSGEFGTLEWDLDDDTRFERTGAIVTTTFDSAGDHEITLRGTGDDGVSVTTTRTVVVGADGEDSPVAAYTDTRGVVTTDGLQDAVSDWSRGEISTSLLQRVVAAWSSGDPVS